VALCIRRCPTPQRRLADPRLALQNQRASAAGPGLEKFVDRSDLELAPEDPGHVQTVTQERPGVQRDQSVRCAVGPVWRADLKSGGTPGHTTVPWCCVTELTKTERRIIAEVADGRTNREIAELLLMSPKTVEWNLTRIYRKLKVRSRTELAVMFVRTRKSL
jgi:DNA-binding CsgD family transcriptional regulator